MPGAVSEPMLLQGTLDLLVLRTLTWGPRHGYAVARWIRETSADVILVEDRALYLRPFDWMQARDASKPFFAFALTVQSHPPFVAHDSGALDEPAVFRATDAALPYMDSSLTAASLAAQWMMTRKYVENWLVWIAVDVVYVPMFIYKRLYPTAALYAVFLVLAAMGWVQWRRSMRSVVEERGGSPVVPAVE